MKPREDWRLSSRGFSLFYVAQVLRWWVAVAGRHHRESLSGSYRRVVAPSFHGCRFDLTQNVYVLAALLTAFSLF